MKTRIDKYSVQDIYDNFEYRNYLPTLIILGCVVLGLFGFTGILFYAKYWLLASFIFFLSLILASVIIFCLRKYIIYRKEKRGK